MWDNLDQTVGAGTALHSAYVTALPDTSTQRQQVSYRSDFLTNLIHSLALRAWCESQVLLAESLKR